MSEQRTHRAPSLVLESVSVTYGEQVAISDASLQVEPGELMALVGPSGCGKSSLLGAINRMSDGVSGCRVGGRIWLDGEDVRQRHDLTVLRRQVGMVFQQPNPFPLSIIDNLLFPLAEHRVPRGQRRARAEQALRDVGLWEEVKERLSQPALGLSGGQQQRLCIARALVLEPRVLLLDEPTNALDTQNEARLVEILQGLPQAILLVSHSTEFRTQITHEQVEIRAGQIHSA